MPVAELDISSQRNLDEDFPLMDEQVLMGLRGEGFFEGVDGIEGETGFSPKDVAVLLSCASDARRPTVKQALSEYSATRDAFFANTHDRSAYDQYVHNLLTLLYADQAPQAEEQFASFMYESDTHADRATWALETDPPTGPRIYYELYADIFAEDFSGLTEKISYFTQLGVTDLWVLPPLESNGLDGGFGVKDRRKIETSLGGNEAFLSFLRACKKAGLRVMLDMVFNHDSCESGTFQAAINPMDPHHDIYKEWYIIRDGDKDHPPEDFPGAVMFAGLAPPRYGEDIIPSLGNPITHNWTWYQRQGEEKGRWVMTRFYPSMPDRNHDNPAVLVDEWRVLRDWADAGGGALATFRLDALKHIFKKDERSVDQELLLHQPGIVRLIESYQSDNLPHNHLYTRLMRAFLEYRYQGQVRITGEVWDSEQAIHSYYGPSGEEAHDMFAFYLMDAALNTVALGDVTYMEKALEVDENVPARAGSIALLGHHDGAMGSDILSKMSPEALQAMAARLRFSNETAAALRPYGYTDERTYQFGGDFSARFYDVLQAVDATGDPDVIQLRVQQAMALLFFTRNPMIFQGDEWGGRNDQQHLVTTTIKTGGYDLRNVCRGIDHDAQNRAMTNPSSPEGRMVDFIKRLTSLKKQEPALGAGAVIIRPDIRGDDSSLLAVERKDENGGVVLMLSNFSHNEKRVNLPTIEGDDQVKIGDLLTGAEYNARAELTLSPHQVLWLKRTASVS